jgi:hypothetical protein
MLLIKQDAVVRAFVRWKNRLGLQKNRLAVARMCASIFQPQTGDAQTGLQRQYAPIV